MQEQHLFEYAVIRIVPRVEREEFFNAGIIIFCKKENHLKTAIYFDEKKCISLFSEADIHEIKKHLSAFEQIAGGDVNSGPISLLDAPSRFRWLTAKRSTIIQTSAVHPGLSKNMEDTLQKLLHKMIV